MTESLRLARGVRLAREEDLPRPREEALARLAAASLSTGYTRTTHTNKGFSDYFEINAHVNDIWPLFAQLASEVLPDVAAPLVGHKGEEPHFGPYTDRDLAIQSLMPFAERLVHDGFIEFGAMRGYQGRTEEVLVKSYKYICVWTSNPDSVLAILARKGIAYVPNLQFLDEFPCVTESLKGEDRAAHEVIEGVVTCFQSLPPR